MNKSELSNERLMGNDKELTDYLHYIRHQKKPVSVTIEFPNFADRSSSKENRVFHHKPSQAEVGVEVQNYLKLLKEVNNMDSYTTKKIFKNILLFLEQFPTMNFLYEVTNAFGKVQKKLTFNELSIKN